MLTNIPEINRIHEKSYEENIDWHLIFFLVKVCQEYIFKHIKGICFVVLFWATSYNSILQRQTFILISNLISVVYSLKCVLCQAQVRSGHPWCWSLVPDGPWCQVRPPGVWESGPGRHQGSRWVRQTKWPMVGGGAWSLFYPELGPQMISWKACIVPDRWVLWSGYDACGWPKHLRLSYIRICASLRSVWVGRAIVWRFERGRVRPSSSDNAVKVKVL